MKPLLVALATACLVAGGRPPIVRAETLSTPRPVLIMNNQFSPYGPGTILEAICDPQTGTTIYALAGPPVGPDGPTIGAFFFAVPGTCGRPR